ncbi:MAG: PTS lactose/cellobiose transporter subunit IIA [Lachnospiraceae bacterium]|jgi:PTS system cellobiose-specific IIA component|nr:PTS lactose/cellobiose transporter subunit IIA [Lachnospiraceae bacterium]
MGDLELCCCKIISSVGTARSCYVEAIHMAKEGQYEEAERLIAEGRECFIEGHDSHLQLFAKQGEGELEFNMLVLHAEDQLMSAEAFGILAEEFISVYKKIEKAD